MSWRTVFADDQLQIRRSRLGWGVGIAVFVLTGGIGVLLALQEIGRPPEVDPSPFDGTMLLVGAILAFVLPFIAMLASYSAIIVERESGSVRFLLGLPNSRLDAYAGKYCSRSAVFALATLVGFGVLAAVAFVLLSEPSPVAYLLFLGATLLYGLVFVGLGLAASAVLDSETAVTAGIISIYVAFRGGWMALQYGALRATTGPGESIQRPYPDWYFFLGRANPMNAYAKLVDTLFNEGDPIPLITTPSPPVDTVATGEAYALAVLVVWAVVVPVLGYLRFRDKDVL